ncbi:MAG: excinuclease ABC subunit UvrC [Rhodobacteraceae bacterium]|nr:excinuclease ABC subunit UvrC [Paracoccaceae bacterium]
MSSTDGRSPADCTGAEKRAKPVGVAVIKNCVAALDNSPGVYRMLNLKGEVLYVGKAKNLRSRVRSYTNPAGHSPRIAKVIETTASMMFLSTETETEALLLEQNLIKQLKPKYNVLLRDDKSFPNILISREHAFPQIRKHRGRRKDKGSYFGPFASAASVNRTLNQLQKAFLLRSCSDAVFESRSRPCLLYQIKRCSAPCMNAVSTETYADLVSDAESFLNGKTSRLQAALATQMEAASAAMEFERAAVLRDRIQALSHVQAVQAVNPKTVKEADIIGLFREGGNACIQVFFIRANQNWGNHAYYPRIGAWAGEAEILEAFLAQFYSNKTPPPKILLSHPVASPDSMQDILSRSRGRRVRIALPKRGEKAELVESAVRNARKSLAIKLSETQTQVKLLQGLADFLGLDGAPQRIEVYDNSHIQGTDQVGAMIVSGPDGLQKSAYRKFNIRGSTLTPGDDVGMMREVLHRRFNNLMKRDPARSGVEWPDLVLVDGGAGQVAAACSLLAELGIEDVPLAGIAKGRQRNAGLEQFHLPGGEIRALQPNEPVLYLIQRMRDEAHRFAIGAHRSRRAKSISSSPLNEIPGIGAARKAALLAHFGSAVAVSRAGLQDLKSVNGISDAMAENIHAYFRQDADPTP